jgi:hypothetical protein
MVMRLLFLVVVEVIALTCPALADSTHKCDGEVIHGTIVQEDGDRAATQTHEGLVRPVQRSDLDTNERDSTRTPQPATPVEQQEGDAAAVHETASEPQVPSREQQAWEQAESARRERVGAMLPKEPDARASQPSAAPCGSWLLVCLAVLAGIITLSSLRSRALAAKAKAEEVAESRSLIQSVLEPGEEIVARCEFVEAHSGGPFTAVLLQERIMWVQFRRTGRSKPRLELMGEGNLRLDSIRSTSKTRVRQESGQDVWVIWLDTPPQGQRWTSGRDEAEMFRDAIERMLKNRRQRAAVVAGGRSVSSELASLRDLVDSGILTEKDWEQAKASFLGRPPDKNDAAVGALRKLHELSQAGVLTESEFRQKKWDILSRS